jgi:hypothetical protein
MLMTATNFPEVIHRAIANVYVCWCRPLSQDCEQ